jgi:phage terminase large subunit
LCPLPRGKNHLYDLWTIAQANPKEWFSIKLTLDDTQHIPFEEIEKEKREGIMSEDLIAQEFYCSWDLGVEGSYYSKYLDKMRINGRITSVPYESTFPVHTAWDLGIHDATCIIFFQVIGTSIHVIDCYENTDKGLDHYAKILSQKGYPYGKHIAPHDIQVRELGTGVSRLETSRNLGINFITAPNLPIEDGIEAVRAALSSKVWIDETNCSKLLKALENYRREYDSKKKVYKDHPLHDFSSHFSDAFRMLCVSLPKTQDGMSAEELNKIYRQKVYGDNSNLPGIFSDQFIKYQ